MKSVVDVSTSDMPVDFDHKKNLHTVTGPREALPFILEGDVPRSVLDVGCGVGTWLAAFEELGVTDIFGLDGVDIPRESLLIDKGHFKTLDLSKPWSVGRRFDLIICLEVAEHLPSLSSADFVAALCSHSDRIIFSAGCPKQPGQNHINCQWPEFWQDLFNHQGFLCEDSIRPTIWDNKGIEVWYRQNIFSARRSEKSGSEPPIRGMVHPDFLPMFLDVAASEEEESVIVRTRKEILSGGAGADGHWIVGLDDYFKMLFRAIVARITRKTGRPSL